MKATLIAAIMIFFSSLGGRAQSDSTAPAMIPPSLPLPTVGFVAQFDTEVRDFTSEDIWTYSYFNLLRLYVGGKIDDRFSYVLQGNALNSFDLLDAKLSYTINDKWKIDVGQFKAPFGREFLKNDADLLFRRRSVTASTIGPQRQRGIQVRSSLFGRKVLLLMGVFTGAGIVPFEDGVSLAVTRVTFSSTTETVNDFVAEIGGGFTYSYHDSDDLNQITLFKIEEGIISYWSGNKAIYGLDGRIVVKNVFVQFDGALGYAGDGQDQFLKTVHGLAIDIGWRVSAGWEIAGRWERFDGRFRKIPPGDLIQKQYVLGVNWFISKPVKLQFNIERNQTTSSNSAIIQLQYAVNHEH